MEIERNIDLSGLIPIALVICIVVFMCCVVKEATKINIEKEQTKQLELQLQIEQEKNK